jgi:4-oxalocrotonate tautomerase
VLKLWQSFSILRCKQGLGVGMPFVQIHMVEGRSEAQREKLAKAITDLMVEVLGVTPDVVWIQFVDMPKTHFATGGVLKSKKQ